MNGFPYLIDAGSMPAIVPVSPDEVHVAREVVSNEQITTHRHSYIEIILFESGEGEHVVNDVEYGIVPGTMCLILPSDVHEQRSAGGGPVRQRRCSFDASLLMKALETSDAFADLFGDYDAVAPSFVADESQVREAEALFDEVEAAAAGAPFGGAEAAYVAIRLLAFYMQAQPGRGSAEGAPADDRMWRALRMAFACAGDRSLDAALLAREAGLSVRELQARVVDAFDEPLKSLISEIRSYRAASILLAFPGQPVGDVRARSGFGSDATMFRAFGARFGMSPNAYREAYLFRSSAASVKVVPYALSNDILVYLYEHYADDVKLEGLANLFGVNAQQLGREFKLYLDLSFNELLAMMRIKRATALLAATNLPIATVSEQCGFSSHRVFLSTFRGVVGMTPRDYRKSMAQSDR